ncbi:outer membrane protein [Sphingomonas sp. CJ99]
MRTLTLLALGAATIATPAMAQEVQPNWTGGRIAVLGGYDNIRSGSTVDSDIEGDDQSIDGFQYSAELGFDYQIGGAVIGAEAEIGDSTAGVDFNNDDPNYFGYGTVRTGRDLYLGARAGVLATPSTLVYAKAGYTNARLDVTASDGTTELGTNFKLDGYRLGAGVEQAIGSNTFAKVEYRYSNYGDARLEFNEDGGTIGNFDVDTDRHQVVAGVGIRF